MEEGPTLEEVVANYCNVFSSLLQVEVSYNDGKFVSSEGNQVASLTDIFKVKDGVCSTISLDEAKQLVSSS